MSSSKYNSREYINHNQRRNLPPRRHQMKLYCGTRLTGLSTTPEFVID